MSIDIVDLLIRHGGEDLLMQVDNKNMTILHSFITNKFYGYFARIHRRRTIIERISLLINRSIELQVGGEYSIGGLFNPNTNQQVQDEIYDCWHEFVFPALDLVMANEQQPILQALIIHKAPPRIIKDLIDRSAHVINIVDSFDNYPIDVAVQHKLSWDDGMKQIVEAFTVVQQTTTLNLCARHGVQWENGIQKLLESSDIDEIDSVDASTSLYPFMVAAVGDNSSYDLDSVFHLIKSRPLLVQKYSVDSE